ncbi:MAG: hypothetical protein ACYCST_04875 [Acidimicrobiales bacterium]
MLSLRLGCDSHRQAVAGCLPLRGADLLDVAFRVATADTKWADKHKLLTVALRHHVSAQEAQGN